MSGATRSRGVALAPLWLAVLWIGALALLVRDVPFLSEDYTHLAVARARAGVLDALSLANEPLRPLQHLYFFALSRADAAGGPGSGLGGGLDAGVARGLPFVLHLAACLAVYSVARALGLARSTASVAALLFALFPNIKGVSWCAALSTSGRALFLLLAWLAWLRARATGSIGARAGLVAAFVAALAFHESAIVFPALVVAWSALEARGGVRERVAAAAGALRQPHVLAVVLLAALDVLYVAFAREQRHHGLKELDALPANVAKAALALAPQDLRVLAIEGLRGKLGAPGWGAAALAGIAGLALAWSIVRRGSTLARFAVAAVALDLALPVLSTGFVQRYAYLASAFAALALAAWVAERRSRLRALVALVLGAAWLADGARDALAVREAGRIAEAALDAACRARAEVGDARSIALVDVPDVWGREEDIPLFNWGLRQALERRGCAGPWLVWRRGPFHTGTDVALVDAHALERALADPAVLVLVARPPSMELVPAAPRAR